MKLAESGPTTDSIHAICGFKGTYSMKYYNANFRNFEEVSRVFSYEAMLSEIKDRNARRALNGFQEHLNKKSQGEKVTVYLIEQGKLIKDILGGDFDPSLSFGLAIRREKAGNPQKAIVHSEMDAERLRHLIGVEGVIIDRRHKEVLQELLKLQKSFDGKSYVVKDDAALSKAATDLENECKTYGVQ